MTIIIQMTWLHWLFLVGMFFLVLTLLDKDGDQGLVVGKGLLAAACLGIVILYSVITTLIKFG